MNDHENGLQWTCGPACEYCRTFEARRGVRGASEPPPNPGFRIAAVVVFVLALAFTCSRAGAQETTDEDTACLPRELAAEALEAYERAPEAEALREALDLREAASRELRAALAEAEREAHEARAALDLVREARDAATRRARRRLGLAAGGSGLSLVVGALLGFLAR